MTQENQLMGKRRTQRGFSLIEVMIAMVVLTVGLCGLIATFGTAITATASAQEDLVARHKALDAMESIYAARNSQQLPFASINNVANGGIFLAGAQPLLCAGPKYGIVGVNGDTAPCLTSAGAACPNGGVECMVLPGPDGVLGTGDDEIWSLGNFTRTIAFNTVLLPTGQINTNMIAVTITVSYTKPNWPTRNYIVNGLISAYH